MKIDLYHALMTTVLQVISSFDLCVEFDISFLFWGHLTLDQSTSCEGVWVS